MTINDACNQYNTEQNPERKENLKKAIIKFCNENPSAIIPDIAKKIYITYLCK